MVLVVTKSALAAFVRVRQLDALIPWYRIKVTGKVGWFAQASALGFLTRATLRGGMGGGGGGGGGYPGGHPNGGGDSSSMKV